MSSDDRIIIFYSKNKHYTFDSEWWIFKTSLNHCEDLLPNGFWARFSKFFPSLIPQSYV